MLLKFTSDIIRFIKKNNFILTLLLLFIVVSYVHAQETTLLKKSIDAKKNKNFARNGLITPEKNMKLILREQIRSEQKEERDYFINQPSIAYTGVNEQDSLALIALYNKTGGDNWENKTNWLSDAPLYQWHGITLNVDNTRVIRIFLDDNKLSGPIPAEIKNLTELEVLKLDNNQLTGPIPSGFGELTHLYELYLHKNKLSESIPEELGKLDNLSNLLLYSNNFVGEIPEDLGKLKNLKILWLDNNKLEGSIPDELGNLLNLEQLTLYNNKLTGPIPRNIEYLKKLKVLWLNNNKLYGLIPAELGFLPKLETLDLSDNKLYGSIPKSFEYLTELLELIINNDSLEGIIPPEIGKLTKLEELYLANNNLKGSIPSEIGKLDKLKYIQLSGNNLGGQIPSSFGDLESLIGIWLYNNKLEKKIPIELGKLKKKLKYLSLYSNKLDGVIPVDFGELANLEALFLDYNMIKGSIPSELGKLSNLRELDFSVNKLSGSIPPELGNLTNLQELHLYENVLTGAIPNELGNLAELKMLSLGRNKLTDPNSLSDLQTALLKLKNLTWFLADGNEFTKFPDLSTLHKLQTLEIQNNRLHFDALEPNIGIPNFIYAPQDSIGKAQTEDITSNINFELKLGITIGGSYNQYQWYRGGTPVPGATTDPFIITNYNFLDTGHYILHITNTKVKKLTLYSRPLTKTIKEEITLKTGKGIQIDCLTCGLKISADVEHNGDVRVLFFNSEPKPGNVPESVFKIADVYFTFEADPSLNFSNAKIMIPIKELKDRGIDPNKIKWLRRPESGKGEWIDLGGKIENNYFVSQNTFNSFSEFTFGLTEITHLSQETYLADEYRLVQNYPNPFNPNTTIKYSIPNQSNVKLKVYDLLGTEVTTLVNKLLPEGNYKVEFDGKDLTSGIYFYRLQVYPTNRGGADSELSQANQTANSGKVFVETKKMVLLQ